ncbi:SEC10/PgrA surface exclusion domain-containing protein [Fructobacillus tropaeoli]|uniref:Uncharacterized protein n=1 Tax=Fructobacillus tropaeoli TaxID=709323 RepID=A0A3F3H241_9LACO|nr:SEC10/PgrA surface exclusion domain-containing protein [Fructobacillus tropaeoli]GAP05025.1 hypothetical protein FTRO_0230030 [Fructobacillus tropaeoli]
MDNKNKTLGLAIAAATITGGVILTEQTASADSLPSNPSEVTTSFSKDAAKKSEDAKLSELQQKQQDAEKDKQEQNVQDEAAKKAELEKQQADLPAQQKQDLEKFDSQQASDKQADETSANQSIQDKTAEVNQAIADKTAETNQAISDKQTELNADPARTADAQREAAKSDRDNADAQSDKTYQDETAAQTANRDSAKSSAQSEYDQSVASEKSAKDARDTSAQSEHDNAIKSATDAKDAAQKTADETAQVVKDADARIPATSKNGDDKGSLYPSTWPKDMFVHNEAEVPLTVNDPFAGQPDSVRDNLHALLKYEDNGTDKSEHVVNGQMTDAQFNELNDYFITVLNNHRRSLGLSDVVNVTDTKSMSDFISNLRASKKMGYTHTTYYDLNTGQQIAGPTFGKTEWNGMPVVDDVSKTLTGYRTINDEAHKYGLQYTGEDLGALTQQSDKGYWTMAELKTGIQETIAGMVFDDGYALNGHKKSLEAPDLKYVAIAFTHDIDPDISDSYSRGYNYDFTISTFVDATGQYAKDKTLAPASTAAQKIQDAKNSYGATQAQRDAANRAAADLTQKTSALSAIRSSADATLATKLADSQKTFDQNTVSAKSTLDNKLSQADSTFNALQSASLTKLNDAKNAHQKTYVDTLATLHDENPAERDARHAATLAQFKSSVEAELSKFTADKNAELANFKNEVQTKLNDAENARKAARVKFVAKQAEDLTNFPAKMNQELEDYKKQLQSEYDALVASNKEAFGKAQAASLTYLDSLENKFNHAEYRYDNTTGKIVKKDLVNPSLVYNPETEQLTFVSRHDGNVTHSSKSVLPDTAKQYNHQKSLAGLIGLSLTGLFVTKSYRRKH